jgi:hypothetical protein
LVSTLALLPILLLPPSCCAWTAAAACLTRDDVDRDLCSMISDMLRFLRMGFLANEFDFDIRVLLEVLDV